MAVELDYEKINTNISRIGDFVESAKSIINQDGGCFGILCSICPLSRDFCDYGGLPGDRIRVVEDFLEKYGYLIEDDVEEESAQPTKLEIKPFKMKVNPEQSKIVQEILFKNGYKWTSGDSGIADIDKPYLYFYENDEYCRLSFGRTNRRFIEESTPELSFNEFIELYADKQKVSEVSNPESKEYQKVCIKSDGSADYGKKIIQYLENIGGRCSVNYGGIDDGLYYFVNYCGLIELNNCIPEGYTEISLKEESIPSKPEYRFTDGEFIFYCAEIVQYKIVDGQEFIHKTDGSKFELTKPEYAHKMTLELLDLHNRIIDDIKNLYSLASINKLKLNEDSVIDKFDEIFLLAASNEKTIDEARCMVAKFSLKAIDKAASLSNRKVDGVDIFLIPEHANKQ